jgi:hypothetical protein
LPIFLPSILILFLLPSFYTLFLSLSLSSFLHFLLGHILTKTKSYFENTSCLINNQNHGAEPFLRSRQLRSYSRISSTLCKVMKLKSSSDKIYPTSIRLITHIGRSATNFMHLAGEMGSTYFCNVAV